MKNLTRLFKSALWLCLIGVLLIVATNYFVKSKTKNLIYTSEKDTPNTMVAIIFGAGINGNKPSKYLKDRLDAGILLYKTNKVAKFCCRAIMDRMSTTNLP
ncbi:hypothetical protein [Pedobacter sp. Leaf194]|uniref:hypothetical protein n=1 Tax=Pedobacter sp. Leaf194 TaxID=1736297 RepID=UPI000AAC0DFC|nr:hypothetical protein [Pedobacter sp. Leaf194]